MSCSDFQFRQCAPDPIHERDTVVVSKSATTASLADAVRRSRKLKHVSPGLERWNCRRDDHGRGEAIDPGARRYQWMMRDYVEITRHEQCELDPRDPQWDACQVVPAYFARFGYDGNVAAFLAWLAKDVNHSVGPNGIVSIPRQESKWYRDEDGMLYLTAFTIPCCV